MNHLKRSMLVCMLAIVLTILLSAGVVQAAGLSGGRWSIVKSPNTGKGGNLLQGVAVVSASDIWAVGYYSVRLCCADYQTLIEHWNGTRWQIVSGADLGSSSFDEKLLGVAAVSTSDVWAVGYYSGGTLIEHWDGSSWQVVPGPNVGALFGVTAISATDIWAVGGYYNTSNSTSQTLIEHWDGTSWQIVSSPNVGSYINQLFGVTAISATDIWAVGEYVTSSSTSQTLIEHWDGSSWQIVSSPSPGSGLNQLNGAAAVSTNDVWAVGYGNGTLIEHWNGSNWQVVSSPNLGSSDNGLSGVAVISAKNLWAVGSYDNTSNSQSQTLIEHWNGTNWQVVASPNVVSYSNGLSGVAVVSARNLWAVGDYVVPGSTYSQTLIEHWIS